MVRLLGKIAGGALLGAAIMGAHWMHAWALAVPANAAASRIENPAPTNAEPLAPVPEASALLAPNPVPSAVVEGREAATPSRTPPLENTRNFLIIGLDRRPDGGGAALADTLILVVLDERSGHVGLVSIPRDLYVSIPDHPSDRINTVYALARRTKQQPLELVRRVVEDTLKLPIEHALAIDLSVFERAVDAVAGVDVDVPCAISDRFLDARAPEGRRLLDVDAGHQNMDGVTAAMYARSRHGRSDFSRARRQQAVLVGLRHKLSEIGGMLRVPALWTEFEHSIETDFRRLDLFRLARRALDTDPRHLHGLVLAPPLTRGVRVTNGRAVLLPESEAIDAALRALFSAPSPGTRPDGLRCEPKDAALHAD
jgi:polyisoprenyl-teichoic acid--peptidoglycan teichoic acid transferase